MWTFGDVVDEPGTQRETALLIGSREDGSPISVPIVLINGQPGPTLLLVALQHGTEILGAEVIRHVVEATDPTQLRGRILAIPVANPLAFLAHSQTTPRDGANLNRVYPGNSDGTISQRIAHAIYSRAVSVCDAVVDYHTNSFPAVHWVIAKVDDTPESVRSQDLARAFGLTLGCYSRARERQLVGTLVDAAMDRGVPGILVELTAHMMILPESVAAGVRGTRNVMRRLMMIDGPIEPQPEHLQIAAGFTTNHRLRCRHGGIVHHLKRPGEPTSAGEVVAEVRTPAGRRVEEIVSPADGFVLSFPRYANQAVMTGDHVAFFASGTCEPNQHPGRGR